MFSLCIVVKQSLHFTTLFAILKEKGHAQMGKDGSLKESIYHSILEKIFNDEYKPNQILNEKELVAQFGCSKSPIRDALITLCNEGVLRCIPRYGYEVIRLTRDDIIQMLDYRLILESGLLRSCYHHISEAQLVDLAEVDELCNCSTEDVWIHWGYNQSFHTLLASYSSNEYACLRLSESMQQLKRAYAQFYWNKWDNMTQPKDMRYHSQMIENIRKRDIDQAVEYLKADLADFGM